MKLMKLAPTLCAIGFLAVGALGQDKPGTIAGLEFQTPKNGMVKQYEDGRKAKVEWHKRPPHIMSSCRNGATPLPT